MMNKKTLWMIIGASLALVIVLTVILWVSLSPSAPASATPTPEIVFRQGKVLQLKGSATLQRGNEEIPVYENMIIQGEDTLATSAGSQVQLQLDEDKYLVIEEAALLTFKMEGNPQKGFIRIDLTEGTVHHTIENPLSKEDRYEVHTPEAIMAVRGTEFTTSRNLTSEGGETRTDVSQGQVEVTSKTSSGESEILGPNESTVVKSQNTPGQEPTVAPTPVVTPMVTPQPTPLVVPTASPTAAPTPKPTELVVPTPKPLSCGTGHYEGDGKSHVLAVCGDHYECDGNAHGKLDCDHFVCDEEYGLQGCGHCGCEEGAHVCCPGCNNWICDPAVEGHEIYYCGHVYYCNDTMEEGHVECERCGDCLTYGQHGEGLCTAWNE